MLTSFGSMPSTAEEMVQMAIDDYFFNLRQFCISKLPPVQIQAAQRTGSLFMRSMLQAIHQELDPQKKTHVMHQIQLRFMNLLRDYDRKWIWTLFNEFSEQLPENMMN